MDIIVELKPPLILLAFCMKLANMNTLCGSQESGILHLTFLVLWGERRCFLSLGAENVPKLTFCLLTVLKGEVRVRETFRWGSSLWSSRNAHSLIWFFLTEKQIHATLTLQSKVCSKSQRFPPNPTPQRTTTSNLILFSRPRWKFLFRVYRGSV